MKRHSDTASPTRRCVQLTTVMVGWLATTVAAMAATAHDDLVATSEGQSVTVAIEALLANDAHGGSATFDVISAPTTGTLACDGTNCTYQPDIGATGEERFFYRLTEPAGASTAEVVLQIHPRILPFAGDWNGDGKSDLGWYNGATQDVFFLDVQYPKNSAVDPSVIGTRCVHAGTWGIGSGILPLAGDWTGDGVDEVGFFDPALARYALFAEVQGSWSNHATFPHGKGGVGIGGRPIAGDWYDDGRDHVGLLYADGAVVGLLDRSAPAAVVDAHQLIGLSPDDRWPLAVDWGGDGTGMPVSAVWAPAARTLHFSAANTSGPVIGPEVYSDGTAGLLPVAGYFDHPGAIGFYDPASGGRFEIRHIPCAYGSVDGCSPGGRVILLPPPIDPFSSVCGAGSV